jgi:hypothetical protein
LLVLALVGASAGVISVTIGSNDALRLVIA